MLRLIAPLALGLPLLFLAPVQPVNNETHVYKVHAVDPITVGKFALTRGFVIGADGVARTCPDLPGVNTYIRSEAKGDSTIFQEIDYKAVLMSKPERAITLACLKIE